MTRELSSMVAAPFVGDLLDKVSHKCLVLGGFVFALTVANVAIIFSDNFWFLLLRAILAGVTGTSIRPGIASLTLGIVGPKPYDVWVGRTEVANHAGCVVALLLAGLISNIYYPNVESLFVVFGAFGLAGVICICSIPAGVINVELARSQKQDEPEISNQPIETPGEFVTVGTPGEVVTYGGLLQDKNFLLWVMLVFLFHFSNAAVLPLLGQVVGKAGGRSGMIWACSLLVIANIVSMMVAASMKSMKDALGWKRMMYIGWGVNIPRIALIVLVMWLAGSNQVALSSSQVFDGISAAINGIAAMAVTQIVVEDSGRFGLASGVVNMCWGAGVALGNVVFGYVADESYEWAFIACGLVGLLPLLGLVPLRISSSFHTSGSGDGSSCLPEQRGRRGQPTQDPLPNLMGSQSKRDLQLKPTKAVDQQQQHDHTPVSGDSLP